MWTDDGVGTAALGPPDVRRAIYRPLDLSRREIRIVQLHPGEDYEPVSATLVPATLAARAEGAASNESTRPSSSIPYEAMSYKWGPIGRTSIMYLNDRAVLIPASAVELLRTFRSTTADRLLWVDAVSINQDDLDERASQVAIMGEIYESAARTHVWLGATDKHTARALRICRNIAEQPDDPDLAGSDDTKDPLWRKACQAKPPSQSDVTALRSVFRREWFGRAWVFQEAVLSRDCTCWIGSFSIRLQSLVVAACWLVLNGELTKPQGVSNAINTYTRLAHLLDRCRSDNSGFRFPLALLISTTKRLQASNPRDKINCLLALWAGRRPGSTGSGSLQPDYRIPLHRCIGNAVRACIFEERKSPRGQLSILQEILFHIDDPVDTEAGPWPSWIRCSFNTAQATVPKIASQAYAADDHTCQDLAFVDDRNHASKEHPDILSLQGLTIDRVAEFIHYVPKIPGEMNDRLEAALQPHFDSAADVFAFCAGDSDGTRMITGADQLAIDVAGKLRLSSRDSEDAARQARFREGHKLADRAARTIGGARVFRTMRGRMGFGAGDVKANDRIAVLFGSRVPFVVGERGGGDVLVGTCFVRGVMQGESMRAGVDAGRKAQVFRLR